MISKAVIRSLLYRTVPWLEKVKKQTFTFINHEKEKIRTLNLYKDEREVYERRIKVIEDKIAEFQFKVDVIDEIIRRKEDE